MMNVREVLETIPPRLFLSKGQLDKLAPIIETALDAVIDEILGQGIPNDVRAAWHAKFVAAMVEEG